MVKLQSFNSFDEENVHKMENEKQKSFVKRNLLLLSTLTGVGFGLALGE